MENTISLIELAWIFFEIGALTIGGGVVAITFMQELIVDRGLISPETFCNMVAISESTPGPIGINMATYIGYTLFGVRGAIFVTISEAAPSVVCIIIIAHFLTHFKDNPIVATCFKYLRPAATVLIVIATLNICATSLISADVLKNSTDFAAILSSFNIKNLVFYACLVLFQLKFKLNPLFILAIGAIFGVVCC